MSQLHGRPCSAADCRLRRYYRMCSRSLQLRAHRGHSPERRWTCGPNFVLEAIVGKQNLLARCTIDAIAFLAFLRRLPGPVGVDRDRDPAYGARLLRRALSTGSTEKHRGLDDGVQHGLIMMMSGPRRGASYIKGEGHGGDEWNGCSGRQGDR